MKSEKEGCRLKFIFESGKVSEENLRGQYKGWSCKTKEKQLLESSSGRGLSPK